MKNSQCSTNTTSKQIDKSSSKIQALYSKDSILDQHYQSVLPMPRTIIT